MKILALNWRDPLHPEAGGAEVHLDKVLSHLAVRHEVLLVSTKVKGGKQAFRLNGYEVERTGHPYFFHILFRRQWEKDYCGRGFDMIIDDISKIGLSTPSYIRGLPILGVFHHMHGKTLYSLLPWPMAFYTYHAERWALKSYEGTPLIAVSLSTKEELRRFAPFSDVRVVPNGLEETSFVTLEKKPFQICSVGRLTRAKSVHLSLEAFALIRKRIPHARLVIAGKGKEEGRLRALVERFALEGSVEFQGFLSEEEKTRLYGESSLLLFTTEKEGWGISAMEASAAGTPVFAFSVPGVKDSVQEGVNGMLAPFGDVEALAQKAGDYLLSNAQQRHALRLSAQAYARSFSWKKVTAQFEEEMMQVYSSFKK